MGFTTTLAVVLGLQRPKQNQSSDRPSSRPIPQPNQSGVGIDSNQYHTDDEFSKFFEFSSIMRALDGAFATLDKEIQGHRAFNPDFACKILSIKIRPLTPAARQLLEKFFSRGKSQDIAVAIQREILPRIPGHCFNLSKVVISKEDTGPRQPSTKDPLLEALVGPNSTKDKECEIIFDWDRIEPSQLTSQDTNSPSINNWFLHDAKGKKPVKLKSLMPDRKLTLGNNPSADVVVQGHYTSGTHGRLWLDEEGIWWYQDAGSANGSRVIRAGHSDWVSPGRPNGKPLEPIELTPGAILIFAAHPTNELPADYPRLILPKSGDLRGTPIITGPEEATLSTPIVSVEKESVLSDHPPIAIIQVEYAKNRRTVAVEENWLPFTIGRSSKHRLSISEKYGSVSRDHLEILGIEEGGFQIRMLGTHNASINGKPLHKHDEAIWSWDQPLILVESPTKPGESACRLILQRAVDAE